jgi:hypothetical protein
MNKNKIYCFSSKYFSYIDKLNYIPVGLGDNNFPSHWIRDNIGINISHKNKFYDMYSFHYWFWKNEIKNISTDTWIGFCTYRRLWKRCNYLPLDLKDINSNIIQTIPEEWSHYDVVLPPKLDLSKIKKIKVFKNNFNYFIKHPSILFNTHNYDIKSHFEIFHDKEILNKSINLVNIKEKKDFINYLNNKSFHPWNLFFCKSTKLLTMYYESVFEWLFKCEEIIGFSDLKNYRTGRIYAYLAERYLSFWFEKYSKVISWPILFLDQDTQFKLKN